MTLTELKTLIQNYVENEETTFVATLNDFIINVINYTKVLLVVHILAYCMYIFMYVYIYACMS